MRTQSGPRRSVRAYAKLVGNSPGSLKRLLEENYAVDTWIRSVKEIANPFGDGRAAVRIVKIIEEKLATRSVAGNQPGLTIPNLPKPLFLGKSAPIQPYIQQKNHFRFSTRSRASNMKRVPETQEPPADHSARCKNNLLTILVEDYFHVGAFENLIQQRNWANFEPRYEQNTLKTLDLLDRYDTKATFFVLGWIAEQNPDLIREIVARGHEVASRGFYHRSPRNLTPEEFREDLRRTNRAIEDACGQKVAGYRAAEKIVFRERSWMLEILADEGFAYDASFLPLDKDGKAKRFAHQVIRPRNRRYGSFLIRRLDLGLGLLPISGGNYFRQMPYTLMRHAVRRWHKRHDDPFVFYFHVWELDPEQPRISAASKVTTASATIESSTRWSGYCTRTWRCTNAWASPTISAEGRRLIGRQSTAAAVASPS